MACFSVTMENVSRNGIYVNSKMTVEITPMSRGQMVLFVVGVLDTFLAFLRTLCVGLPGQFWLRSTI